MGWGRQSDCRWVAILGYGLRCSPWAGSCLDTGSQTSGARPASQCGDAGGIQRGQGVGGLVQGGHTGGH